MARSSEGEPGIDAEFLTVAHRSKLLHQDPENIAKVAVSSWDILLIDVVILVSTFNQFDHAGVDRLEGIQ